MPGARVNIIDVAERAGVSPATVSRSLRGLAKVAPETRQRVLDAARDLSYVASLRASGPAAGSRPSVAVIVPFITRWFFSTVTAGAVDFLRIHGYDVLLYHLGSADIRDHFFERMPLDSRVDGILTLSMPLTEEHTLALRALDLPMVSVGTTVPGSPSVGIDEVAAARGAVNHLLHLKHERIGFIAGAADDPRFDFVSSEGRRRGYEQALRPPASPSTNASWRPARTASKEGPLRWHSCCLDRSCRRRCSRSTTNSRSAPSGLFDEPGSTCQAMSRSSESTTMRWPRCST